MGKKRKSRANAQSAAPLNDYNENPRLLVNSYEDVADSEDEFHINRDKVLLDEGPARKRQRKLEEDEQFLQASDEEILPLPPSASASDKDDDLSDEEDDGIADSKGLVIDDSDEEADLEDDLDKEGWGKSKRDWYGGDALETEQDGIEEEEEALRLQKKQLEKMDAADFFDESEWLDSGNADQEGVSGGDGIIQEVLPQMEITENMPVKERNEILAARYPEFAGLSKEYLDLQAEYEQASLDSIAAKKLYEARQAKNGGESIKIPGTMLRWAALSAYISALSLYFAIFTSGPLDSEGKHAAKAPAEMRCHSIMETLMKTRTTWLKVKDLKLSDPVEEVALEAQEEIPAPTTVEVQEVDQRRLQNDKPKKPKRKSKAQLEAETALAEAEARRIERLRKTEAKLDKLARQAARDAQTRTSSPPPPQPNPPGPDSDSDFGEVPTAANDPSTTRRKKSLQFYTSQIAQKAKKRTSARDAGGDTDIPYRERFRVRQARLNAAAEARGRKEPGKGAALGESSSDEEDARAAAEIRGAEDTDGEEYYASVASATAAKKAEEKKRKAAQKEAKLRGATVHPVEEVGPDGKRAISYQIEKNRGLMNKTRTKAQRNPRVKRRSQYEKKMKKLKSVKGPQYKGEVVECEM